MPTPMRHPPPDAHIAPCGLFCSNCRKFRKGRCAGCQVSPGFARCAVRACCVEKGIPTCAGCSDFAARDFRECRTLHNPVSRVFAVLFGSDRPGALAELRDQGEAAYLERRRASGRM